jgi:hypothetical protein
VWGTGAVRCIGYLATAGFYLAMTEGRGRFWLLPRESSFCHHRRGGRLVVGDAFFFAALTASEWR